MADEPLTERERLELLRREDADRQRKANESANRWLRAVVAEARAKGQPTPGTPSAEEVATARARLLAEGKPAGVDTLARLLNSTPSTVRRRPGRLK